MPLFKKKAGEGERSGRLEELEAHVRHIRKLAAEDSRGASGLQSFLIEDGYWESPANRQPASELPSVVSQPGIPPETPAVDAASDESVKTSREDEAMLQAELQRYLARMSAEREAASTGEDQVRDGD